MISIIIKIAHCGQQYSICTRFESRDQPKVQMQTGIFAPNYCLQIYQDNCTTAKKQVKCEGEYIQESLYESLYTGEFIYRRVHMRVYMRV